MTQHYAILLQPSTNRVYSAASKSMCVAELTAFARAIPDSKITNPRHTILGGVSYLTFDASTLSSQAVALLSNISSLYALFEVDNSDTSCHLKPLTPNPLDLYDSDLLSILKFAGKTNEQFTKLLLNVTMLASRHAPELMTETPANFAQQTPPGATQRSKISVLDPLAGRGTTINQALMYGLNAAGIEIDKRDFEAYGVFINRWLKEKRLKHQSKTVELRRDNKVQAHRHKITLANHKEAYKAGNIQTLDFVLADTLQATEFFKQKSIELIVADLPYGIKHANHTSQANRKSPQQLLEQAVPVWTKLLKPGGAMGLAWNTYLLKKSELVSILQASGLSVHSICETDEFRHRVDQAIVRDIVVAVRE